jgi:outer membrane protein OmpA-like peptidoglycan-associated protein
MDVGDPGDFGPIVELTGQIVSAGIALGAFVTGKKFPWAPKADGLPQYSARIFGVVNGIGLAYLWHRSKELLDAPDFSTWALYLLGLGVFGAVSYLICSSGLTISCEADAKQYVGGLWLRWESRRVLKGRLDGLPEKYAKIHQPGPASAAEYFCKSGKDPDFIWPRWSHVAAQVLLFLFYGVMLTPLSLAITSAAMGLNQEVKVVKTDKDTVINLPAEVLFEFNKSDLQPNAARLLDRIAADLRDHKVRKLRVEGHTDSIGGDAYNQKLSEDRAAAVKRWLMEYGKLGDVVIAAVGFGMKRPIAPNTTPGGTDDPYGRAKNRRVSIVVEGQT